MVQPDEKNQPSFAFSDPDDYTRMRDILETAGFMDRRVLETIGISDLPSIDGNEHPLLLERTASGSPLHTLIRLFLMDAAVDPNLLQKTINPMPLEAWHRAGLIRGNGAGITATIKLLPFQGLVMGFDRPDLLKTPQRPNYVMGIGGSTITLSRLTIRRSADQVLDLGTGCGIHALLAAAHSDRVTASDINPRALRLARFNARLNAVANVECLEGRFFEPVPGRRFDLVITNPPFVISPETRFIYRDSGMASDAVCRHIVREVPPYLSEGGVLSDALQLDSGGGSGLEGSAAGVVCRNRL